MAENENSLNYSRPQKICICNQISEEQIVAAIKKGNNTLEKIKLSTKACTSCASCEPRVIEILKRELSNK